MTVKEVLALVANACKIEVCFENLDYSGDEPGDVSDYDVRDYWCEWGPEGDGTIQVWLDVEKPRKEQL